MTGTIGWLAAAMGAFFASHVVLSARPVRAALLRRLGRVGFLGLYSSVSISILYWLASAYGAAPMLPLWPDATWTRWVPVSLMPFACIMLVAGLTTRAPTSILHKTNSGDPAQASGIVKITRHPVMGAFALWAFAHLVANGDAASLILFGSLLALALAGPVLIDRKRAREMGEAWTQFAAVTSIIPFVAILTGRNRVTILEVGIWRIVGGLALYLLLIKGHPFVIGPAVIPF
jgi:uncharacterized membrane protein